MEVIHVQCHNEKALILQNVIVHYSSGSSIFTDRFIFEGPCFEILKLFSCFEIIFIADGSSLYVMTDNHATNRSLHNLLRNENSSCEYSIDHPVEQNQTLYLLFDSVHLLKCIRNNWITLPTQTIEFQPPGELTTVSAKWSDLIDIRAYERI